MIPTLENLIVPTSRHVLFECIAGSRAYGTTTATSDTDLRGVFAVPAEAYLELGGVPNQVADERGNTVYFSLRRPAVLSRWRRRGSFSASARSHGSNTRAIPTVYITTVRLPTAYFAATH